MAQEEHHKQQELRVVVLGRKQSGRTTLINKTLGLGEFSPGKGALQEGKGEVGGRTVIMVDTLGWWRKFKLIDTAEFIKLKLQQSVSKCPPGPHAFILTVMIDIPFDEETRRANEEHLGLLGENIWKHTIVVFTRGDALGDKSIKQHTESEGEALKWLVEKCGNRYCVFDSQSSDCNQVTKLLDKIENVLASNSGRHFELDEKTLKELEEKTEDVKKKAEARSMRMKKQIQKQKKEAQVLQISQIRILLVGWVTSRKTSTKNTILGIKEAFTKRTMKADIQTGEVSGLKVSVVDTPGWWKYFPAQSTPEWVKTELQRSLSLGLGGPHAILLAVPADTTFPEEQRKITEDNMKMFGEQAWRHTMVLFTCGDLLGDTSIEEHIESEGKPLQWLVEKCGNRYHVFDNVNMGDGSQVTELLERIKEMVAGNSSYTSETQNLEVKEITGEPEELGLKMGNLLDKEWNRMDRNMEEKMKKLYEESVDPNMKENSSAKVPPNFKEIESEGELLQRLVKKCGNRYHIFDNINMGDGSQVTELLEKIKEMVAGNELGQTTVEPQWVAIEMGMLLDKEWTRMDEEMEEKIKELGQEMKEQSMQHPDD